MSRDIKESDWKLLRQLAPVALERFCQRTLEEISRPKCDRVAALTQLTLLLRLHAAGGAELGWVCGNSPPRVRYAIRISAGRHLRLSHLRCEEEKGTIRRKVCKSFFGEAER